MAIRIYENEKGVFCDEESGRVTLAARSIRLPRFEKLPNAELLRMLHHEVLINIVNGKPLPNLWVYTKPWYRDGAMMMMVLEKTGNTHLLKHWVMNLRDPFDENNGGDKEPDNLGQALYLIACVSNASHPLVTAVLQILPSLQQDTHLNGHTDGGYHSVYQTKWLKLGLKRLKIKDEFEIPSVADSYSSLFWTDYREHHVAHGRFDDATGELYPYLNWAEAHFYNDKAPMAVDVRQYPQSWEAQASQADYSKMAVLSREFVDLRLAAPHSWHAAEMFLYYLDRMPRRA